MELEWFVFDFVSPLIYTNMKLGSHPCIVLSRCETTCVGEGLTNKATAIPEACRVRNLGWDSQRSPTPTDCKLSSLVDGTGWTELVVALGQTP